jgi:ectoine hydroxylase-related dioxygenase (phytanoyl-CoA dioxygenase family)
MEQVTKSKLHLLSQAEVNHYVDEGYHLYKKQLFNAEELTALTQIFEEQLAQKGAKLSDELDTPHFRDKRLLNFLLSNKVLDLVEDILGPNIGLFSSHFICKDPFVGRRTPWHEDSSYWQGKFDRLDKIVTIWLAIDDSSLENGCMGVVPGTHKNGFSDYEAIDGTTNTFDTEIKKGSFNEEDAVWFQLNRGECSMHDARIIHGANANTSPKRRCGYTMRYFSLDMKFNGPAEHLLWHARGENIAGNILETL